MLWSEVRELFPNQFVLVQVLKSHQDGNKLCSDEMVIIRPIPDPREATNNFVYHTGKPGIVKEVVSRVGFRRSSIEDPTNDLGVAMS